MDKFYYIYNPHQANFYLLHNVPIIEIGKGGKGDTYIKFPKNEYSTNVFNLWIERCKQINQR
jgi:hypothetical protein